MSFTCPIVQEIQEEKKMERMSMKHSNNNNQDDNKKDQERRQHDAKKKEQELFTENSSPKHTHAHHHHYTTPSYLFSKRSRISLINRKPQPRHQNRIPPPRLLHFRNLTRRNTPRRILNINRTIHPTSQPRCRIRGIGSRELSPWSTSLGRCEDIKV